MRLKTLFALLTPVILTTAAILALRNRASPPPGSQAPVVLVEAGRKVPPVRRPDPWNEPSNKNALAVENPIGISNDLLREFENTPANLSLQKRLNALANRGYSLNALTQQALAQASNLVQEIGRTVNRPIDFYGKIVDEGGAPIVDAHAEFSCQGYPEEYWTTNLSSARDGTFALRGRTGAFLYVHIALSGYEEVPNTNQNKFEYYSPLPRGGFNPDPNNPVVFYVRKRE